MKYYVFCKEHPEEKIYINFGKEIATKNDVPFSCFSLTCPTNNLSHTYNINNVKAEEGFALGGAFIGALLFLVDPVLGLIGAIAGLLGMAKNEHDKVEKFNNSNRKQAYS